MEKKKLDWIISIIREEMMTANPPGKGGGVGAETDPTGKNGPPGFSPVISFKRRRNPQIGPQIKLPPGSRKRWMEDK